MNRIDAARRAFSRKFASRPVRAALAVKIALAILAADVSFAAAKAVFHAPETAAPIVAASVSTVKPFILPIDDKADAAPTEIAVAMAGAQDCHEVVTAIDEGYGLRGTVTRTVCRKAL